MKKKRRQTFVFSATLTMIHGGPQRSLTKKKKSLTMKQKLGRWRESLKEDSTCSGIYLQYKEITYDILGKLLNDKVVR